MPPQTGGIPYGVVARQVAERLDAGLQRHRGLLNDLDLLTNSEYTSVSKNAFSAARRANLDAVDWRVPRLIYSKDPKFNEGLDPRFAFEVQQRKMTDGQVLEAQLAREAEEHWRRQHSVPFPEAQVFAKQGVAFVEAVPHFRSEEDIWSRRLELRTLDEAVRGDVSQPMPRPAIFAEDYENFRQGRYVRDNCPIA